MTEPIRIEKVRQTREPVHKIIEGKGLTVEIASTKKGGWLVTATSHRGNTAQEIEAVGHVAGLLMEIYGQVVRGATERDG